MIDWIEFLNGIGLNWLHYASLSFYCMSFYPELIFSCCSGNHFHEILCWLLPCVYIHMYVCVCWISNFGTTQLISENSQQQQQLCVFSIFYQFGRRTFFLLWSIIHEGQNMPHVWSSQNLSPNVEEVPRSFLPLKGFILLLSTQDEYLTFLFKGAFGQSVQNVMYSFCS